MKFSEESTFIMKNWDIIEKLCSSQKRVKNEFTNFLYSVEKILNKKNWWNTKLTFNKRDHQQIYVSHKKWYSNEKPIIWIGVEHFSPERLLGSDDPAQCYLWITEPNKIKIISELNTLLGKDDYFEDYFATGGGYVLKKYLKKYTDEEYKDFISGKSLNEIVEFIENVYLSIESYELLHADSV